MIRSQLSEIEVLDEFKQLGLVLTYLDVATPDPDDDEPEKTAEFLSEMQEELVENGWDEVPEVCEENISFYNGVAYGLQLAFPNIWEKYLWEKYDGVAHALISDEERAADPTLAKLGKRYELLRSLNVSKNGFET